MQQQQSRSTTFATWNSDALRTTLSQAMAYNRDVLALQEMRIDEATAIGMSHQAKKQGFHLIWGTLPKVSFAGKKGTLNPNIPGVGFLIKKHLSYRQIRVPVLDRWEKQGRCSAIQVFLQQRWVTCLSIYAPVQDPTPLLKDVVDYADSIVHEDVILMGNFNQDTREGDCVLQLGYKHWAPLTAYTDVTFMTFRRKNAATCIDTIVVSPSLAEHCQPVQNNDTFKKGHSILTTHCFLGCSHTSSWEQFPKEIDPASQIQGWDELVTALSDPDCPTTVQQDWERWCAILSQQSRAKHPSLGVDPQFRLRDQAKMDRTTALLQQAVLNNDAEAVHRLKANFQKLQTNAIRKWRNNITPTLQKTHVWIKNLFAWIRPKNLPPPICIQSSKFGIDGSTTCVQETLLEIDDFLQGLYKASEAAPDADLTANRFRPDMEQTHVFVNVIQNIIQKQNVDKAHGLDGLTVAQFKAVDAQGIKALSIIFQKVLSIGQVPRSWVHCRVSCIPKKCSSLRVRDLRPLCIAPVALRIFSKTLLVLNSPCQQNVSQFSVGGIQGRQSMQAWVRAATWAEWTWRHNGRSVHQLQGVAIDTEKFF